MIERVSKQRQQLHSSPSMQRVEQCIGNSANPDNSALVPLRTLYNTREAYMTRLRSVTLDIFRIG
jgi:hypothetical protein